MTILKLPPHTSHVLQPLDKVIFKGMKVEYYRTLSKWQREHPGKMSKMEFATIIASLWDKYLIPAIIQKSFSSTGSFDPSISRRVNRDVIDKAKFDPVKLTRYLAFELESAVPGNQFSKL